MIRGEQYKFSSAASRKSLYFRCEATDRLVGGAKNWMLDLAEGLKDAQGDEWTDARVRNFNQRREDGVTIVLSLLTQS